MTAKPLSLELEIEWESTDASHKDRYFFTEVDIDNTIMPAALLEDITNLPIGAAISQTYAAGELVTPYSKRNVRFIDKSDFHARLTNGSTIALHPGRFYPRKFIANSISGLSKDNQPFRLLSLDGDQLQIDLNHPLSLYPLDLSATLRPRSLRLDKHAQSGKDLIAALCDTGPGLQANAPGICTEFLYENAFSRTNTLDDSQFYEQPRLVAHLDAAALTQFSNFYSRFVKPGMKILDLMSSWKSHLPENIQPLHISGLGMNREEMRQNKQLSDYLAHDLNRSIELPFPRHRFDLAICTVSVEYLIDPVNVFRQVALALKPGAPFVLTFSERWFPPKVVQVWTELHPFERMGLILEYFRQSKNFDRLGSESLRGLPRPPGDKYAGAMSYSDPLYAVWGYSKAVV